MTEHVLPVDHDAPDHDRAYCMTCDNRGAQCKHCGRTIYPTSEGVWIDPEAGYDDEDGDGIWRTTCDKHDTFAAEHEPECGPVAATWFGVGQWPTCTCGLAPRDNAVLTAHWREQGFEVVDQHGELIKRSIEREPKED